MEKLYKLDWKILNLIDKNRKLTLRQITHKLKNGDSEDSVRKRTSKLFHADLISYTKESVLSSFENGVENLEEFEITSEGHNLVADHSSEKSKTKWKEFRVSVVWPFITGIVGSLLGYWIRGFFI
ncbi:hypothetical protein M3M38_07275 [Fructilactobacillus cliffordii]|uniref:hypothetical protein n=1 Tax=Fructilactobacillus cliffordii TaxID=2940299 RepID=UPI002093699F|nr:hypothetical protein [Fructilactobacillus cliffordii]USS86460.1 hypothetical protein M3M38_07275 [Fructilactobacillus cliffordii]